MTRKLLIATALAATGFVSVAAALGLGSIDSQSALNQPLRARIELLSADPDEVDRLTAQLASPEAFERAGLERPFFLSRLDFDVVREGGSVFLEVTTDSAVKEPFLDFLVEVSWPNGRLLREYTLLLDPPTYTDDIAPAVAASGSRTDTTDAGQADAAEARPAAAPAQAAGGEAMPAQYGPVRASDTLYGIAQQVRPEGVSVNQAMLALLRTNPDAFIDGNINALRRGAILRMPERQELTRLDVAEANAEVREQMARWQERRSAPATAGGAEVAAADAEAGSDAGDDAAAPGDDGEAASEAAAGGDTVAEAGGGGGELRLVAPDESEGVDATTSLAEADLEATPESVSRLQGQLALLDESNADLRAENDELRAQVDGLRQELDELQRMINLRLAQDLPLEGTGEPAADAADDGLDGPVAAGGEETGAEVPAVASAGTDEAGATAPTGSDDAGTDAAAGGAAMDEPATATAPEVTETAQTPEEQPAAAISFLEMMLADTRLMTYAGGGLVALLLLLMLVQRRRRAAAVDAADEGLPAPTVAPVAAAGGAAAGAAAEAGAGDGISAKAGNPLEEAELYLAYGRADQAQEVLDRALGEEPDNIGLRTRLLEILAERGDRGGFEAEAQVLHTQLPSEEDPRWQRIVELGGRVAPEHPLFADATAGPAASDTEAATPATGLDAGRAMPPAEAAGSVDDLSDTATGDEDFAFALDDDAADPFGPEERSEATAARGANAGQPARADDAAPPADAGGSHRADDDAFGDLEFDLGDFTFGEEEPTAGPGDEPADAAEEADRGLDFSPEQAPEQAPADAASDRDSLEFRLDDDLGPADAAEAGADQRPSGLEDEELDFGDLSLDEPRQPGGDSDEGGDIDGLDEVGTKLDLARAYMDMGDSEGARSLLDEVTEEGNEAQRREAEELLRRAG